MNISYAYNDLIIIRSAVELRIISVVFFAFEYYSFSRRLCDRAPSLLISKYAVKLWDLKIKFGNNVFVVYSAILFINISEMI